MKNEALANKNAFVNEKSLNGEENFIANADINSFFGREKLVSFFIKAKKNDRLSHTYILEGEEGMGKKTLAKYLSLIIMCDADEPCLKCKNCTYTLAGTNPDIYTVSNEDKASIGIAKIREMITEAYIKPSVSEKRIFIIDKAHLLTKEAQNALLKIIEEPPQYCVFILLCENTSLLLPTVLSRGVTLKLEPLCDEDMARICKNENGLFLGYAGGNPGKLIKLLNDENFTSLRDSFFDVILNLLDRDGYAIYKILDFFEENKDKKDVLMQMAMTFFFDVMLCKNGSEEYLINKDKANCAKRFCDALSEKKCLNLCEIVSQIKKEMGKYGAYTVNIHSMLIKFWEEIHGLDSRSAL